MADYGKYTIKRGKIVNKESGKTIPADEPVVIFRAQDLHLPSVLGFYSTRCINPEQRAAVRELQLSVQQWHKDNESAVKEPDA